MADNRFETPNEAIKTTEVRSDLPRYATWLIVELEQELHAAPEEFRQQVLQEVEDHIRCRRQALLELGAEESTADKQSVAAFGPPSNFVRALSDKGCTERHARRAVGVAAAVCTCFALALQLTSMALIWIGFILGSVAFISLSWKARSFVWRPLVKWGIVGSVACGVLMGCTWVNLWPAGGIGYEPRLQIPGDKRRAERKALVFGEALRECDPIAATYSRNSGAVEGSEFYRNEKYLTFVLKSRNQTKAPSYSLTWLSNYSDAAATWKIYAKFARKPWFSRKAEAETFLATLDIAAAKPFDWGVGWQGFVAGLFFWSSVLLVNFVVHAIYLMTNVRRPDRGVRA